MKEFRDFKQVQSEPSHLARTWLASAAKNHIPLSERAKEILMKVVAINIEEKKLLGKYETVEAAEAEVPAGTTVIDTENNEEVMSFSITQLTDIFNSIAGADKSVKGFSDKATAARRIQKLVEGPKEKPAKEPKEKKERVAKVREPGQKTDRERVREFLVACYEEDKTFTVKDVAELLGTNNANASTGINLLKTRPGKNHQALVTGKQEDGSHKVIQAPTALETEAADAAGN